MTTKINRAKTLYSLSFLLVCSLILASCGSGSIVQDKFTVADGEWKMNQIFTSKVKVTDTISTYNFYLNVRNGGDYPYSNLHVFVTTTFPNGGKHIDTVNCPLADKSGRWYGKGLGDILDNRIQYKWRKSFPMSGEYKISMQHAMRDTVVPAILNLGLSIEKAN